MTRVRRLFGWMAGLVGLAALARVLARRERSTRGRDTGAARAGPRRGAPPEALRLADRARRHRGADGRHGAWRRAPRVAGGAAGARPREGGGGDRPRCKSPRHERRDGDRRAHRSARPGRGAADRAPRGGPAARALLVAPSRPGRPRRRPPPTRGSARSTRPSAGARRFRACCSRASSSPRRPRQPRSPISTRSRSAA